MKQGEMSSLFGVPDRTLRDWKKGNRNSLYELLENLSLTDAKRLLNRQNYLKVLENEKYFSSLREFEKYLYPLLLKNDTDVWLKLSKEESLSDVARARSAYVYSFLTHKKSRFKLRTKAAFYHGNRPESDDELVKLAGLKNGINEMRFTQFKTTGTF